MELLAWHRNNCLPYFQICWPENKNFPILYMALRGPSWLSWRLCVKESVYHAGDAGSIPGSGRFPGSGRSPGVGNDNPLSCLKNPMDRRAWWATVYGVAKSRTRLSDFTFTFFQRLLQPPGVQIMSRLTGWINNKCIRKLALSLQDRNL